MSVAVKSEYMVPVYLHKVAVAVRIGSTIKHLNVSVSGGAEIDDTVITPYISSISNYDNPSDTINYYMLLTESADQMLQMLVKTDAYKNYIQSTPECEDNE